jgi:hypothetical protein
MARYDAGRQFELPDATGKAVAIWRIDLPEGRALSVAKQGQFINICVQESESDEGALVAVPLSSVGDLLKAIWVLSREPVS